jgi:ATP-binding cassette subfamily B protein RaxB
VGMSLLAYFAVAMAAYPMMRRRTEEQLVESAAEQSFLMESVRAASTIQLLGREAERESLWRNAYARVVNANVSVGKWQITVQFAQTLIMGLQTAFVVLVGARAVLRGEGFSLGMLMACLALRQTFTDRATNLVAQALQFRLLAVHLDRLGDIVTAKAEIRSEAPRPMLEVSGAIRLEGVNFRYGFADPPILTGIDLEVAPGEFVAITGVSGGGKTTLLKVMLGLHAPTSGAVFLEGQPAGSELFRAWREHVGVVAQDDRLLSGTLAANIAFFDPAMDMERVLEAAGAALIHDDISRMPMQYMSPVGDMGSALSGGQKQRVLLARALYRRPKILFLDEGTANLDIATELQIANIIAGMSMTRIVVAHRPALLERADRVLTVSGGMLRNAPSSTGIRSAEVA